MPDLAKFERKLIGSLEFVGSIEWDGADYQFNMTNVWKERRGVYYIASDAGCSCPYPFENFTYVDELDGPHNKAGIRSILEKRIRDGYYDVSTSEATKYVRELLSYMI